MTSKKMGSCFFEEVEGDIMIASFHHRLSVRRAFAGSRCSVMMAGGSGEKINQTVILLEREGSSEEEDQLSPFPPPPHHHL